MSKYESSSSIKNNKEKKSSKLDDKNQKLNNSHQQNLNNDNSSLIKNRSSSNSYIDKFKSNLKTNLSSQQNNSLLKPNYSDKMNFYPTGNYNNIPFTPSYNPSLNMTPISFTNSKNESGFFFSENIHVFLRIRPFSNLEISRGDTKCIDLANPQMVFFNNKTVSRNFSFDQIFGENSTQEEVFQNSFMNKIIDEAIEGYACTILAYGQTGSGKTYTILGREDSINENILNNDNYSGLIAKAIKYLWHQVNFRKEKYFLKVSYMEIYNEQINDLLNIKGTNLQMRGTQNNSFFVEGATVIECKHPNEVVEILLEGNKNRKVGSHELNKDSSRSHSIFTIYVISETFSEEGQVIKKYGKVSLVDLAGSERLKESKSQGDMIKETGNINKSLFMLGKVISILTEKRDVNAVNKKIHIPYRDSKLTMLLSDSLGGKAKTILIACVSPSSTYGDETLSTINYATRAMNIQNKPIIQMDARDQLMVNLKQENQILRKENEILKMELMKYSGINLASMNLNGNFNNNQQLNQQVNNNGYGLYSGTNNHNNNNQLYLPPINSKNNYNTNSNPKLSANSLNRCPSNKNKKLFEYNSEKKDLSSMNSIISDNTGEKLYNNLRSGSENLHDQQNNNLIQENVKLKEKIANLENAFLNGSLTQNSRSQFSRNESYNNENEENDNSALINEIRDLKKQVQNLKRENLEIKERKTINGNFKNSLLNSVDNFEPENVLEMQENVDEMSKRIEFLQKRERDLLETINKLQNHQNDE